MEARLAKQPASQNLHTTAGLTAAKNTTVTNDNNVFISAQCRIKTILPKDQKNTDPAYGQWGKPWPKDTYMSGGSFLLRLYYSHLIFLWLRQRFSTNTWKRWMCTGPKRREWSLMCKFLVKILRCTDTLHWFPGMKLNFAGQVTSCFYPEMQISRLARSMICTWRVTWPIFILLWEQLPKPPRRPLARNHNIPWQSSCILTSRK